MSNFCCPPTDSRDCISNSQMIHLASNQAKLEAGYREFIDLLKQQDNLNGDYLNIAKYYLELIQASAENADKNSLYAASSALESLKIFNNNYNLLKNAFDNFYAFVNNLGVDLTYTFIDVDTDYNLSNANLNGNIIFRIIDDINFNIDVLSNDNAYIGKIIHIRNCTSNMINITADSSVTLNPVDLTYLRREGSTIGLIYVGNNQWDLYGELP